MAYCAFRSILHVDCPPKQPLQRGHAFVADAARNDPVKIPQIRIDVEGETVRCNPARDVNSHRHQLVVAYPNASESWNASGGKAVFGRHADENLFEGAHVPGDIAPMLFEIENRITHKLAWSMIGDIPAAVGFVEFSAKLGQPLRLGKQIFALGVASERVNVRMLQKEKRIRYLAGFALGDPLFLQVERRGVIDPAAMFDVEYHIIFVLKI